MSESSATPSRGLLAGLPEWARPRTREDRGLGSLRLAETTILVLFGLFLALATVADVVKQTHVNHRIVADLRTWRVLTGHDYHNVGVERDVKGHTTRETVCGNVSPGGPGERTQVCLVLVGPVLSGRREVSGGYYLPAKAEDRRRNRYACFGAALQTALCGLQRAPAGAPPAPALPTGRG
jgi:hypothetical protein